MPIFSAIIDLLQGYPVFVASQTHADIVLKKIKKTMGTAKIIQNVWNWSIYNNNGIFEYKECYIDQFHFASTSEILKRLPKPEDWKMFPKQHNNQHENNYYSNKVIWVDICILYDEEMCKLNYNNNPWCKWIIEQYQ